MSTSGLLVPTPTHTHPPPPPPPPPPHKTGPPPAGFLGGGGGGGMWIVDLSGQLEMRTIKKCIFLSQLEMSAL